MTRVQLKILKENQEDRAKGRPLNWRYGCSYCGRTKQNDAHKTCDGCGAARPHVFGYFGGRAITNPDEAYALMCATAYLAFL